MRGSWLESTLDLVAVHTVDFNLNDWRLIDETVSAALNALRAKIEKMAELS